MKKKEKENEVVETLDEFLDIIWELFEKTIELINELLEKGL